MRTNNLATILLQNSEVILQQSCNSGIAHVKIRVNITYELYLSEDKQSCNNPATNSETILQQFCNSGIAHVKIRVDITYALYLSEY